MLNTFFFTGVDPKTVVCAFFKQGTCTKGDKCKFSHDLAVERKAAKRNLYEDSREDELANGKYVAFIALVPGRTGLPTASTASVAFNLKNIFNPH